MVVADMAERAKPPPIQIVGAGPSGLAAAIRLAQAGREVVVHEARSEVGHRFGGDLQGLENWSTGADVLSVMDDLGLSTDFAAMPCHEGIAYDPDRHPYPIRSDDPLFYMVERGPGEGSLDSALLRQALSLGVTIRFDSRRDVIEGEGIMATGPKAADAIAVGYHFATSLEDGFWVVCDDRLAPKGYAYLLVMNGRGNLKTCMFADFGNEREYLARTVEAFTTLTGVDMIDPRPHGGTGNFRIPATAVSGRHPVVGEQAGFQDTLWGFGIRLAMESGILAAESLLTGRPYDDLWREALLPGMRASVVNRVLFSSLGNRGYRRFLSRFSSHPDLRRALSWHYRWSWPKRLLYPLTRNRYNSRRRENACHASDCHCVHCRGHCLDA